MEKSKSAVISIDEKIAELIHESDHKTLVIWAADCAERVLPYFDKQYPQDHRPEEAIKAGRAWVRGEMKISEVRKIAFASHAAARSAGKLKSASSAARSAGHAAATAHVLSHAVYAAAYAIAAVRDGSESINTETTVNKECRWQYRHLKKLGEKT